MAKRLQQWDCLPSRCWMTPILCMWSLEETLGPPEDQESCQVQRRRKALLAISLLTRAWRQLVMTVWAGIRRSVACPGRGASFVRLKRAGRRSRFVQDNTEQPANVCLVKCFDVQEEARPLKHVVDRLVQGRDLVGI